MRPHQILVLGGGFGGLHVAMELERRLGSRTDVRVTLVCRDNFFLFTPLLHEVAASDLDITHIVSPIRSLLKRTRVYVGEVERVDVVARRVTVSHGFTPHGHHLAYDQLVLGLGCTTNFFGLPGLERHALTMKTLGDAIHLRNRVIATLEEADTECGWTEGLLTFVVVGGGFAGVETIASLNDFVREGLRHYPGIRRESVRMVLIHSGDDVLPELGSTLGRYAERKLADRGIEVRTGTRVAGVSASGVTLDDGSRIPARVVVWTAGTSPHALLRELPCALAGGRVEVEETLAVPDLLGVWALGDCAVVPNRQTGKPHPPTAQHAIRQARIAARNILAAMAGQPLQPFRFRTLGQLAAIGRRTGVARICGINFSGFFAWWLWRTIYLGKLPRLEKKIRVALDWTLDLVFEKDFVQFLAERVTPGERTAEPDAAVDGVHASRVTALGGRR